MANKIKYFRVFSEGALNRKEVSLVILTNFLMKMATRKSKKQQRTSLRSTMLIPHISQTKFGKNLRTMNSSKKIGVTFLLTHHISSQYAKL